MTQLYVLFEHASGFGLFKVSEYEEIGAFIPQVEEATNDVSKFKNIVKLIGFKPFTSAASALENINAISEGILTAELSAFIETNLPGINKKSKIQLGVTDNKLAAAINEAFGVSVTHVGIIPEIVRGIRQHLTSFIKGLTPASMKQTELGLGHSYSRGKVKFNVNRADNMIIQSISILDQLDKDINTFAMRMKEWYSYHFPELAKVVTDNYQYSLCAEYIKDRKNLNEESLEKLEEIVMDPAKAQAILDASRMSMGMDISPIDLMNIEKFAKRVVSLAAYRVQLSEYLKKKMATIAPNLAVLIGEMVGARLISHSGSLTNLAKYPASTVQILGAEKALFRAIKTRSNTPKYGLIYHSSFISRAGTTNKGRISRYLANKCSIATRIDCFSENLTSVYGEKLKEQVEERLKFYESGDLPRKNIEVMGLASEEHKVVVKTERKKAKKRKRLLQETEANENGVNGEEAVVEKKKKKKSLQPSAQLDETVEDVAPTGEGSAKKKKKKKSLQPEEAPSFVLDVNGDATPKKKKKKSLQPGEASFVSENGDEPITTGESAKKKKKKKSLQPEETSFVQENGDEPITTGESAKKKKKKKSLQPGEISFDAPITTGETPKKKKKKSLG